MPPESRKKLYDAVSTKFDIGSFDEFNKKMDDSASRKKFYDSVSTNFDLGDFNTFEGKISVKKKDQSVASATGGFGSQLGSQTFQPTKAFVPAPLIGTGVEDYQKQEAQRQAAAQKLSNKLKGQQAAYYSAQGEQGFVDVENAKLQSDYNQLQAVIQKDLGNKGNDFSITYNKLLQGTGSMISGAIDAGLNGLKYSGINPFISDATIIDYRANIAPEVKIFLKDTIGADVDKGAERKYDENFVTGAIGGLAYSVPAMITPFGIGLYSQAYDSGLDLINSTDAGKNLTETEKTLFAATLGSVMGRLEKIGLNRTLGRTLSSELANGLAFKAINELSKKGGAKITSKAIGDFAEASLRGTKNRLLNSADQGYRAFLDEFTTGGLQEVATIGAEQAVNKLKNKDIFDTQDMGEMFGRVLKSAAAEGFGGAILGTAKGGLLVNTKNHIAKKISNAKSFDDVRNLLLDVEKIGQENNYSPEEVQGVVDTVNDIVQKKEKLPQDLTPAQTTGIVSLMIDRDELTDNLKELEIELNDTDDALKPAKAGEIELVKKQIAAINTRMAEISQNPDYAVQEPSTTSQVPSVIEGGQNIQEGGEGVGQGVEGTQAPQEAPIQEPTATINQKEVRKIIEPIKEVDVNNYKIDLGDGLSLDVEPIDRGGKPISDYSINKDGKQIGSVSLAYGKKFYNNLGITEGIKENDIVLSDGIRNAIEIYDKNNRNKGYGSRVYIGLLKLLESKLNDIKGARILSSPQFSQTIDSYKLWESLYKKGLANKIGTTLDKNSINISDMTSDADKKFLKINGNKRELFIGEDLGMAYDGVPNGIIYNGNIYALDLASIKKLSESPQEFISEEVATLREQEQQELAEAIPNIEEYKVDGEVDKGLITNRKDLRKYNKIYAKYDKLITPLLAEAPAQAAPAQDAGVSATNKSQLNNLKSRVTDSVKSAVIQTAERAINTLKSILPEFDIVIHENEDSYNNSVLGVGGQTNTRGNFSYSKNADGTYSGTIDINLNKANARTVAHEVAHAVLLKSFGENIKLFKTFRDKISKVLNSSRNAELIKFSNLYEGDVQAEEYLAELTAILEQQQDNLSPTVLQQIAAYINDVVSKLTNGAIKPFENIKDTKDIIDFFNTVSKSIREGEAISESDIKAIQEGASINIGSPTTINKSQKGEAIEFPDKPLPLSFVTGKDKVDIRALINDIVDKKQKVWFWMADQLGRGDYYDSVIDGKHYLDAGPSFALDPKNRSKGILWASGLAEKTLQDKIAESDYIFFISGSPEKAKLFNKRVLDLFAERINKTASYLKFKEAINKFNGDTINYNIIKDTLNNFKSFNEITNDKDGKIRKEFLIALGEVNELKTMKPGSLKELLNNFNALIDYNELRDGFYKENGFNQNDIMLIGKPTGLGGKAPHSTYENAIMGEVIGVPDVRIDSWDIMPDNIKEEYSKGFKFIDKKTGKEKIRGEVTIPQKAKVIAAETGQVRELEGQLPVSKSQKVIENERKAVLSEELDDKDINTLRASLRKKAPNSYTIQVLDELQQAKKNDLTSVSNDVSDLLDNGISLSNIKNMLLADEVFESPREVENYFNQIGGQQTSGLFNRLSGLKSISKSQKINWEVSKEGKGDPTISVRSNIVQEAAQNLKEGKITNEEYRATASENSPIGPITRFFNPAALKQIINALSSDKVDKVNTSIKNGTEVGLRLDIPAYQNKNTWVVSVHDGTTNAGKAISYTNVAKIVDVNFGVEPRGALGIASGKAKSTIGRMFGKWENIPGDTLEQKGENAKKLVQDIVNNPAWVQIGMNPFRHSYFYDRSSDIGRPVMKADEVIQVGGLVYAKNPVYGNWTDEAFEVKGLLDSSGKVVKFQKVDGEEQAPQKGGPLARIKQAIDKSKAIKFDEAEIIPSEKGKEFLFNTLGAPARNIEKQKQLSQGAGSFFNKVKRAAIDTKYDIAKALTKSKTPIGDVARAAMRNAKGYTGASSLVIKLVNSQIFDKLSFAPNIKIKVSDKGKIVETIRSERQLFDAFLDANRIINIDARIRDKFSELISLSRELKNGIKNESLTKEEQDELVNQISQLKEYLARRKSLDIKGPEGQIQMIGYQDPDFVYTDKLINLLKEDYTPIQYTHTNGATMKEAEQGLAEMKEQLPELYKTFDKMSSDYYDTFRYLLDESLKNGLITKEVYDELWSYNYIPTKFIQHFIEGELAIDNPSKAKKLSASLKNLTGGSEEDVITNYQYILELYAHATYRRIFDNRAAVKLAQALGKIDANKFGKDSQFFIQKPNGKDRNGNPTYSNPEKGYDYIKYMVDGVENRIIAPKQFVDMWYDSEFQSTPWLDSTVNFFSKLTLVEFIKGVFTKYSPVFGVMQIFLDAPQALISTKAYPDFFLGSILLAKDYATVAKDVLSIVRDGKPTKFFVEAVQAGVFSDFLSTENDLIRGEKFTNYDGTDNVKNKVKYLVSRVNRGVDKTLQTIAKINEAVEYSTRLAVYYRMKQNLTAKFKKDNNGAEPTGQDLENIQLLSAEQARNVVDFSVSGGVGKQANRLFAYLNSAIQVFVSAARSLKNNPWKAGLMMLEIGAASASILAYSLGDLGGEDDEEKKKRYKEYRKRSTYEKESYFLMWTGDPERPFLRIPKPPLFKGLINLFEQAYLHASRGEEFNQEKMWSAFKRDIPFGNPLAELTRNPMINAAIKYFNNYDQFRQENIVKDEKKILDYAETRGATELYKKIGKASKDLGFKEGVSPKRLQEAVRSFTGDPTKNTWASLFDMGSKGSVALVTGDTKELDEMFTGNPISDAFRNLGFEGKLFAKKIDYDASFVEQLEEEEKEEYTKKYVIGNDVSEIRKNAKDYDTAIKSIIEYLKPLVNSKDINAEYADKILKAQPKLYSIKDAPYFYDDVFYANSNKNKAKILNHYISDMSISEGQKIVNDMANRGIITEDVVGMLNELRNK